MKLKSDMFSIYKYPSALDRAYLQEVSRVLTERTGIRLPDLYSKFLMENKVGKYLEKWDGYLDKFLRPTPVYSISIKTSAGELSYNWLNSMDQILHDLKYYERASELLKNEELLRIGDIVDTGGIFLGVGEKNKDLIYKYSFEFDSAPVLLFKSIYEFVDSIKLLPKEKNEAVQMIGGKRYFNNSLVSFENSPLITNLNTLKYSSSEIVSSEFFLDALKKEI